MSTYFITSTGTDIGKTLITAGLIHQLRAQKRQVFALKPLLTGYDAQDEGSDIALLNKTMGRDGLPAEALTFARFKQPLSPDMAARMEGKSIDYNGLLGFCQEHVEKHDTLLIEGAGGVMVPITQGHTMLDMMQGLNAKVILVVGSYLGTLSHSFTAIEVLRMTGLPISAVILNETLNSTVTLEETRLSLDSRIHEPIITIPWIHEKQPWQHLPDLLSVIT